MCFSGSYICQCCTVCLHIWPTLTLHCQTWCSHKVGVYTHTYIYTPQIYGAKYIAQSLNKGLSLGSRCKKNSLLLLKECSKPMSGAINSEPPSSFPPVKHFQTLLINCMHTYTHHSPYTNARQHNQETKRQLKKESNIPVTF